MPEEKIYTIPLKEAFKKTYKKRTPYAIRYVQDFLETHTKKNVKIGGHLNQEIWERGIKKPPRKVKVKVILDGDFAKAELFGFDYTEFKVEQKKERKGFRDKLMGRMGSKAAQKEELEKSIEGKTGNSVEGKIESKTESKTEVVQANSDSKSKVETEKVESEKTKN